MCSVQCGFMSQLLEGKTALVLGVANRWSLAYAIAQAFQERLDAVVHSIAFANQADLARPFVETSREGYLLAQNISAYSMIAVARATAPKMTNGGSIMTLTYLGSTRVV